MSDERKRAERTTRTADELLSLAVGSAYGDLDSALRQMNRSEAYDVLAVVLRELALLCATAQLREDQPGGDDAAADAPAAAAAPDGIVDPWHATAGAEALEAGRLLWEALSGQESVAGLLRGLDAIEDSEARAVVLERALARMAEARRPSRGGNPKG